MAALSLISLMLVASTYAKLGCEDFSYDQCHNPPVMQALHVNDLEECIQNCELFGSFGQCDYLMFFKNEDENCKIISGDGTPEEEMDKYVSACKVVGQPMKNTAGECLEGPHDECSSLGCSDGCKDCDADPCGGYQGTQCQKIGEPGETSDVIPEFSICLTYCTNAMASSPWTYLTFDLEAEQCICYADENVTCSVEVVKFGMTYAQVTECKA